MIRNTTKYMNRFVLIIVLLVGIHFTCLAAPFVLVEQGASDYRIYSSPSASAPEMYAAKVLQDYVARISALYAAHRSEPTCGRKNRLCRFCRCSRNCSGRCGTRYFWQGRIYHTAIG